MKRLLTFAMLSLFIHSGSVFAGPEQGWKVFKSRCADCHAIEAPAADKMDLERIWKRKGPDLYHAGDKFQPEWLREWLQNPSELRPGGVFYSRHVVNGPEGDSIDSASIPKHPSVTH